MLTEKIVKIMGKSITITRLSLKGWTSLEIVKKAMDEAISNTDFDSYFLSIIRFIEIASPSSKIKWTEVPWQEFLSIYSEAVDLNSPSLPFPLLISRKKAEEKQLPWEYEGRSWYFWLNLFASNYGWDETTIGNLDIDTAIGLYQEILIDEQLQKEWQWGLSEIAFPYNQSTKKQEYKPLDRPEWMLPLAPKELPVIRMRKDMLPVGLIVDLQEEYKKKDDKRGV